MYNVIKYSVNYKKCMIIRELLNKFVLIRDNVSIMKYHSVHRLSPDPPPLIRSSRGLFKVLNDNVSHALKRKCSQQPLYSLYVFPAISPSRWGARLHMHSGNMVTRLTKVKHVPCITTCRAHTGNAIETNTDKADAHERGDKRHGVRRTR